MHHHSAGKVSAIFERAISRYQHIAADHRVIADVAIMRDMAGRHDVVAIADHRRAFRLRGAGNSKVFPDGVAIPDLQVTSFALEILIERIGAEHRAGRDRVRITHRGPALDVDVRLQPAPLAQHHVALHHTELADAAPRSDGGRFVNSRGGRDFTHGIHCNSPSPETVFTERLTMTVRELAAALDCAFEGGGERQLLSAAPLESASALDLSFAASAKSFPAAQASQAGCLVVPPEYSSSSQTVIRSTSPRRTFAAALALMFPPSAPHGIHPAAVVASDFQLEERVSIGPGCVIGKGVTIGAGSTLHANVTVYERVRIGCNAILHAGCVIGADGFGFALDENRRYVKFPQVGTVEIGDDVEIGANTCIDRAALGVTRIGDGVKLDNQVHIGHNCQIGKHVVIAAQTGLSGGVQIGDYAIIGGQVGVGDKARIESGAVVGSGAGILTSKIVRAGEPVWGTPARPLREHLKGLATLARLARAKTRSAE